MNTYLIQLRGQMAVEDLNPFSPHQMTLIRADPTSTVVTICTDQSGLIGLLSHLHNLGLTLLAVRQAGPEAAAFPEALDEWEKDHGR